MPRGQRLRHVVAGIAEAAQHAALFRPWRLLDCSLHYHLSWAHELMIMAGAQSRYYQRAGAEDPLAGLLRMHELLLQLRDAGVGSGAARLRLLRKLAGGFCRSRPLLRRCRPPLQAL